MVEEAGGKCSFKSSRNMTPMTAEMGGPAEVFEAEMELKLLADVGLIGLPNAGSRPYFRLCLKPGQK